jgi:para-aminobenzoate synthetase component 1
VVSSKDGRTTVREAVADQAGHHLGQDRVTNGDPLDTVETLLASRALEVLPGLPPFQGGAAGYIGYDYGRAIEPVPAARYDDLRIPDLLLGLYDWVLAWDHQLNRCWLISGNTPGRHDRPGTESLSLAPAEIRRRLAGPPVSAFPPPPGEDLARPLTPIPRPPPAIRDGAPSFPVPGYPHLRSSFTHEAYREAVARVREYILAGDIFQANISQRLESSYDGDPWALYRRLRTTNPAPFAAYLEAPGLAVLSASPERFLRITPEGAVEARPIKGTRPRGIGPEHDAHLGRDLIESEKDRAENLMIVDLLRNDLSRVCSPGSVRAPELFALEHFTTVHHLVSTVIGRLAPGLRAMDVLRATFPGGSITGAPKVRAMEIIAELEPSRRGVYCGSIGYLSATGAADFSIVIRTYLARYGRVYFSVGGGIVADSEPEAEYRETLDKAQALIAALSSRDPSRAEPDEGLATTTSLS